MSDSEYERLVEGLVEKFSMRLPAGDEDNPRMVDGFRAFLEQQREDLSKRPAGSNDFLLKRELTQSTKRIIKLDLASKKRMLVRDESLERLKGLQRKYFELAKKTFLKGDRLLSDMNIYDLFQIADEINCLKAGVREFNAREAWHLGSETWLDANFIYVPGNKEISLGLEDFVRNCPNKTKREFKKIRPYIIKKYADESREFNKEADKRLRQKKMEMEGTE